MNTLLTAPEENLKQWHEVEMSMMMMIMDRGIHQWKIAHHYYHCHNRGIHPSIPQAIASWMHPRIGPIWLMMMMMMMMTRTGYCRLYGDLASNLLISGVYIIYNSWIMRSE
jgi:hypothetical protein